MEDDLWTVEPMQILPLLRLAQEEAHQRRNGIQDMSIDEIDEEIRRARKGLED